MSGQHLNWACCLGDKDTAQRLIDEGADVNWRDHRHGSTPIMAAAFGTDVEVVRLLFDHGADINSRSDSGKMALHSAAHRCNDATVKFLIERGADLYAKDDGDQTPLDYATGDNKSSTAAIIKAAIKAIKVIYTPSEALRENRVTFKNFNDNIIILTDNDIPDGYEYEGHPTFTLQLVQQCIDQLLPSADNDIPSNNIPSNNIHDILAQRHPAISARLQHWGMNVLHLIAYLPQEVLSNDAHEAISSVVTKYSQSTSAVDLDGMTPLHHAIINLPQKKISQYCHDVLLNHSLPIVVHRAIEAGLDWEYLCPIIMTKTDALTMEDEEKSLVPFMLAAEKYNSEDDDDGRLGSMSMVYELLCLQPDLLKEYDDVSIMMKKRGLDGSRNSSDQDTKLARGE